MRCLPALLCLLPGGAALRAAPVPSGGPPLSAPAREELHGEALNYAQQLLSLSPQVAAPYAPPVDRAALLEAALAGLFEAARQPAPAGLRAELRRLKED